MDCSVYNIKEITHMGFKITNQSKAVLLSALKDLKEISAEYSLEGLMLKLKTPILWPPDVNN